MAHTLSNTDDVVDSRDILQRIEDLESEDCNCTNTGPDADPDSDCPLHGEELKTLHALVEEIDQNAGDNSRDGVGLIRDSYFEDYARELADDIGAVNKDATWPNDCIDWERAAEQLQQDYTSLEWDGVTYWFR